MKIHISTCNGLVYKLQTPIFLIIDNVSYYYLGRYGLHKLWHNTTRLRSLFGNTMILNQWMVTSIIDDQSSKLTQAHSHPRQLRPHGHNTSLAVSLTRSRHSQCNLLHRGTDSKFSFEIPSASRSSFLPSLGWLASLLARHRTSCSGPSCGLWQSTFSRWFQARRTHRQISRDFARDVVVDFLTWRLKVVFEITLLTELTPKSGL